MKIYVVRHGETVANKEGRLQGFMDSPLSDYGRELARIAGKMFYDKSIKFDAAFASPLIRARDTAEIILQESQNNACNLVLDDRIKEICAGTLEGKIYKGERCEVDKKYVDMFFADPMSLPRFPDGENVHDVMERTQNFLTEISTKPFESVLVVTHGCALRAMLNKLYDNPNDFWQGGVPKNCEISLVNVRDGKMELSIF